MTVAAADLGTYLGNSSIDTVRAGYLIGLAVQLCESILNPLPDGADAVVLDVAARAYGNPGNVVQQTTGPFSANYGTVAGGLWLTRANKSTLRRLGGGGGAFMIDLMPPVVSDDPVDGGSPSGSSGDPLDGGDPTSVPDLPPWDSGDYGGEGYGW